MQEPEPRDEEPQAPAWRAYPLRFVLGVVVGTLVFRVVRSSWSEALSAGSPVGFGWVINLALQRRIDRKPRVWRNAYRAVMRNQVPAERAELTAAVAFLSRRRAMHGWIALVLAGVGLAVGVAILWANPSPPPSPAALAALVSGLVEALAVLFGYQWRRTGRLLRRCLLASFRDRAVRVLDAAGWSA